MQPHKDNPIEQHRVNRLQAYSILDTPREAEFDQLLDDLVFIMEADGAYLSFMDGQRQWFKSAVGMDWTEIPIQHALCSSTLHTHTPLMVFDVQQDCTFAHSPLVQQAPHIKAFLALPLRTNDGTGIGTLCVFSQQPRIWTVRDTEILRRYTSKAMHLLDQRLQAPVLSEEMNTIMQYGSDGVILLDSTEHILDFNPLAQSITGLQWIKGEEFSTSLFLHDDSIPEIHKGNVFMRWDGQVWFKVTAAPLERDGILLIIEDVTHHLQHQFGLEAKVYQEQTREEGEKNALYEYLQGRIQDHNCSVVYLDLDDFRSINEQHGFQAGDTLLRQVAIRLRQSLRGHDRVYRLSRDEFILVLAGDLGPDILALIAGRVQHNLQKPFQLDFQEVRITASLGLTSTAPAEHVDAVLQRAESLMQQSKQQGKGLFCVGNTPE